MKKMNGREKRERGRLDEEKKEKNIAGTYILSSMQNERVSVSLFCSTLEFTSLARVCANASASASE